MKKIFIICLCFFMLVGCRGWRSEKPPIHLNPNLDFQPKITAQEQPLEIPDHTVVWGDESSITSGSRNEFYKDNDSFYTGKDLAGNWLKSVPVQVDNSVLTRGQQRYNIYCSACHGEDGSGNGIVMEYGWFKPVKYWDSRIINYTDGELFNIISNGIRSMPGYSIQIPEEDRWSIVTYIRAIQVSNTMNLSDVPMDIRNKINR